MIRRLLLRLSLALLATPLAAQQVENTATATNATASEQVVLGLSQNRVAITATFEGSDILVFGAVKRETPIPASDLGVVVTVAGPLEPLTVRRKAREYGIWVNSDAVEIDSAPTFYAVATSAPFAHVMSQTEDLRHSVSIPRAIRAVGVTTETADATEFRDALIRLRTESGHYKVMENSVDVDQQTLFRTSISLPANLHDGVYATRIFLTREGTVVSSLGTFIAVEKVGMERWLYELAQGLPLVYGILAIVIATLAGWGANAVFTLIRNR